MYSTSDPVYVRMHWTTAVLFAIVFIAGAYSQPECTDSTVVKGDIGRPLLLHCRLCSNPSTVTWELENGTRLLGQNNNYRIENVTTAVGGTTFVCRCSFDQDPQCFIVGVNPTIEYFGVTPNATRTGQSFRLECRADGFPKPTAANFEISPLVWDPDFVAPLLQPIGGGVIFVINNASASIHSGVYGCKVNTTFYGTNLVPSNERTSVVVYTPPWVKMVVNSSLCHSLKVMDGTLECVVEKSDSFKRLEWSKDGQTITSGDSGKYVIHPPFYDAEGNTSLVHMLTVRRVSRSDECVFLCQVFSEYSDATPEDVAALSLRLADTGEDEAVQSPLMVPLIVIFTLLMIVSCALIVTIIGKVYHRWSSTRGHDRYHAANNEDCIHHNTATNGSSQPISTPLAQSNGPSNLQDVSSSSVTETETSFTEDVASQQPSLLDVHASTCLPVTATAAVEDLHQVQQHCHTAAPAVEIPPNRSQAHRYDGVDPEQSLPPSYSQVSQTSPQLSDTDDSEDSSPTSPSAFATQCNPSTSLSMRLQKIVRTRSSSIRSEILPEQKSLLVEDSSHDSNSINI